MSTPTLPRPRIDVEAEQWREGASKRTQDQVEAFYEVQEGELRLEDGHLAALVMKGIEEGPLDQASLRVPIALPRTSANLFAPTLSWSSRPDALAPISKSFS
jgi:hypothetical protein